MQYYTSMGFDHFDLSLSLSKLSVKFAFRPSLFKKKKTGQAKGDSMMTTTCWQRTWRNCPEGCAQEKSLNKLLFAHLPYSFLLFFSTLIIIDPLRSNSALSAITTLVSRGNSNGHDIYLRSIFLKYRFRFLFTCNFIKRRITIE